MCPCGFASAGSSYYKMWAGLNGFDPTNNLVFGGVRVGMGCMNLVTAISKYTQVPITLRWVLPFREVECDMPSLSPSEKIFYFLVTIIIAIQGDVLQ